MLLDIQSGDEEERTKDLGITSSGRIIVVVFTFRGQAIRPITAYLANKQLQELYLNRRIL